MEETCYKEGDRLQHFLDNRIYLLKKLVAFPFKAVLKEENGSHQLDVHGQSYLRTFFQRII